MQASSQHRSKALRIAFRLAFSTGFLLVMLELLLRFIWIFPFTAKGAYLCRDEVADHSHYAYGIGRMQTEEFNVVLRMNNIGMRDDDVALEKPAGSRRILVLGDSFMEGWGCERGEIFTDRLEAILEEKDPGAEVIAAGVASWSPLAEFCWLKHKGLALQPDAVVLAVDATDPAGDSFYVHRLVRDAEGRPDYIARGRRHLDLPLSLHNLLADHLYLFRYIDRWLTKKLPVTEWDYGFWGEADDVWAPLRSDSEIPPVQYDAYWSVTKEALREATRLLAEKRIPFLVIMYPTGVEVDSEAWGPGRSTADFPEGVIPPRRFDYLAAFAAADSIPYFSLLPTFQRDSDPKRLYYPYDGHWSPSGHDLAARAVAEELRRRSMAE